MIYQSQWLMPNLSIFTSLSKYTIRTKLLYFSQSWHPSNFLRQHLLMWSWCMHFSVAQEIGKELQRPLLLLLFYIIIILEALEYIKWVIFSTLECWKKLRWKPLKIEWEATERPITCKVVVTRLQTACKILKRQQYWMYSNGLELKRIWWLLGCHMCQGYLAGLV